MKINYIKFIFSIFAADCCKLHRPDVEIKSQYTSFPNSKIAIEAKTADVLFAMRDPFGAITIMRRHFPLDEAGSFLSGDYDNGRYAHMSLPL